MIDIIVSHDAVLPDNVRHVALAIDLASGKLSERSPAAWRDARAAAERVNASRRAAEQARTD